MSVLAFGQRPDSGSGRDSTKNENDASPQVIINWEKVHLKLCDSTFHIYLKVDIDTAVVTENNEIWVYPQNDYLQVKKFKNLKKAAALEMEFYNLPAASNYLNIKIETKTVNEKTDRVTEIKVPVVNDEGIVDVTSHMGTEIDSFMNTKDSSMFTFFCGRSISVIELLAFFTDYLDLTPEQTCELIKIHNEYNETLLSSNPQDSVVRPNITPKLCLILKKWQEYLQNPPLNNPPSNLCKCKLIRTKADAANIGVASVALENDCKNYENSSFQKHYLPGGWNNGNDDDLMLLSGKMGAAKGEMMYLYADGGDKIPDIEKLNSPKEGYGLLTFRSVCTDPASMVISTQNCPDCKKEIELQYKYSSRGTAYAWEGNNLFFNEKISLTMEEFAIIIVANNSDVEVLDTLGYKLTVECDPDSGWNMDTLLNKGLGLYNAIKDLSDVASYVDAAQLAVTIISKVLKPGCQKLHTENRQMSGTKTYTLLPGQRFTAILYSDTYFRGRGQSSVMGYATILSDYYLTAVLKTIPDDDGNVPEYCECEAVASYVWGSLDGQTPPNKKPRDKDKQHLWPDFDGLFSHAPMGETDIKQLIGSFIGTAGEWGDLFQNAGCCAVVIPCHADCVYLRVGAGCNADDFPWGGRIMDPSENSEINTTYANRDGSEELKNRTTITSAEINNRYIAFATTYGQYVRISPNPAHEFLEYRYSTINPMVYPTSVSIYDMNGRIILTKDDLNCSEYCNFTLQISDLESGTYLIRSVFSDKNVLYNRFIKM